MSKIDYNKMLQNIKAEIAEKKLTQSQIAKELHISSSEFSRCLNGRRQMSIDLLFSLEEILHVDVHLLAYGNDAKSNVVNNVQLYKALSQCRDLYRLMKEIVTPP